MIVDSPFAAHVRGIRFQGGFGVEPGFYLSEVIGLTSGGEVTTDDVPRGFGPGAHDTDNRREDPRIITMRGLIIAPSMSMLGRMIEQLGALLVEETDRAPLTWTEFDEWRLTSVQRASGWSITRLRSTGTAAFTVRFRAADQRIYSADLEATPWGANHTIAQRGGYPAPVTIDVRGESSGGYTISGPRGAVVVIAKAISPAADHRYYSDTGLLEVGGAAQTIGVLRSDRIDLPPGLHTFSVNNGCEVKITHRSTWVP